MFIALSEDGLGARDSSRELSSLVVVLTAVRVSGFAESARDYWGIPTLGGKSVIRSVYCDTALQ
jgi:hypothetical protein